MDGVYQLTHMSINVLDLEKSLAFYEAALGLKPVRERTAEDGSFKLVFLADETGGAQLELTWLRDRTEPYDLGEGEYHIGFVTEDIAAAHRQHEAMDVICFENPALGVYFIEDPDGYWLEIVPRR